MFLRLLIALLCLPALAPNETAAQGAPVKLDLSRRDLKNFLADETALAAYRSGDGPVPDLRDVFTFGAVDLPYAVFWDPLACRLIGVLDIEKANAEASAPAATPSDGADASGSERVDPPAEPYLLRATGPFPLAKTPGASGAPRYFGFRLVDGAPEFLYTCGSLPIEERLWLDEGGRVLRQRFFVKDAPGDLRIAVPEDWKGRVDASARTWKGAPLVLPKDGSEGVLAYPLAPQEEPESTPSDPK